ncbi:ABC transporter ATP-binding protein [bacterium]|nr:ABC transporter ATP-binding protein [candidate division CSSED10-310 bacterium]
MERYVIEMDSVSKAFKKHRRRNQFLTLKSTLIRDLWRLGQPTTENDNLFWALKQFDLRIASGETVGLIGSNGSGKSTALKLIAGILTPTNGTVRVIGRLSALIELGAGFHPEISGRENIFINGIMLGLTKQQIRSKFDEIVDFADLRAFIDNPVRTYSSGMFMRLGFAVAVHVDPDILLIDEVLAVGDQSFVHKCLERIFDFKRRGKTIVVVSHDLGSVEKLCSRAVWLSNGERRCEGPSREVIGSYLMSVARQEEARYASEHEQIQEALEEQARRTVGQTGESKDGDGGVPEAVLPDNALDTGKRWGNRKIEIMQFRIVDSVGRERYVFQTGEDVTFDVRFEAKEPVGKAVFGIGIYLQDGTWCYGSNTQIDRMEIDEFTGSGWFRLTFPAMPLIENSYLIDIAVHAEDQTPFDFHSRMYRIAFRSLHRDSGIVRLHHSWSFSDTIHVRRLNADGPVQVDRAAEGAAADGCGT